MSRQWIAFYMGDYLRDTRHLTLEEHGAYLLLLMECWTQGSIPMDPRRQAQLVGVSLNKWKRVWPSVQGFFNFDGTNKRASKERDKADVVSLKRSISGQKGGYRSGLAKAIAIANAKQTASKLASKHPSKNEAIAKPTTIERKKETLTVEQGGVDNCPPPPVATALLDGALPSGATTEQAETKRLSDKKPNEMTKAELDQLYVERRARTAEAERERRAKAGAGTAAGPAGGLPF